MADSWEHKYKEFLSDWSETDTAIRSIARRVLSESQVHGDSYGVPPLENVVEELVTMIEGGK